MPSSRGRSTKLATQASAKSVKGQGQSAQRVIDESLREPLFWSQLLRYPEVERFLRKSLSAKASSNISFAQCIVEADPAHVKSAAAADSKWGSNTPRLCQERRCSSGGSGGAVKEVRVVSPSISQASTLQFQSSIDAMSSASNLDASPPSSGKRNLSTLFDSAVCAPMSSFREGEISEPAMKKLRFTAETSSCPTAPDAFEPSAPMTPRPVLIPSLPAELSAHVLIFLTFAEKVSMANVRMGARGVLAIRSAWDPLQLGETQCAALLRHLRALDPFGCFPAEIARAKTSLPAGLFKVEELSIHLMEPDRGPIGESDTEDEAPKSLMQVPTYVLDPLDEVCKRLKAYFPHVRSLQITNIEDHRMDYRFATLRPSILADFPSVRLMHQPTSPPTYALQALKDADPPRVDVVELLEENRRRVPMGDQMGMHFDDSTWISEAEALFLLEHTAAFKSADNFHFTHTPWRIIPGHGIRKRYRGLVADLKIQPTNVVRAA